MTAAARMWLLPFTKMHGAGNDYVFVDGFEHPIPAAAGPAVARFVADRHFGVGSDGLIVLGPGETAACRMHMWNADGSRGAMCGNGLRCLAVLARRLGRVAEDEFVVETDAGPRPVAVLRDGRGDPVAVRADMGPARIDPRPRRHRLAGRDWECWFVDVGSSHLVAFVDGPLEAVPLELLGPALQSHPDHPEGVNVNVVTLPDRHTLRLRTFERGSGETLACGTCATASAAAAVAAGRAAEGPLRVLVSGGVLEVLPGPSTVLMAGPARTVCTGEVWVPPEVASP